MKSERHDKIIELIEEQSIDKQEELLRLLHESGFSVTQATVSRDIRELHLVKTATGNGGYRYVTSFDGRRATHTPNRFETIFKESVLSVDGAGNLLLVKCFTGMANAACEVFDSMVWNGVVGTLAGDDTFMILLRTETAAKELKAHLAQYMPRR